MRCVQKYELVEYATRTHAQTLHTQFIDLIFFFLLQVIYHFAAVMQFTVENAQTRSIDFNHFTFQSFPLAWSKRNGENRMRDGIYKKK